MDDTFLILLNAHHEAVPFSLPGPRVRRQWQVILDRREGMARLPRRVNKGAIYYLEGRSLALFRLLNGQENLLRNLPRLQPSV